MAEGNPINPKGALKMPAKLGYRADVVCKGLEALQAARPTAYADHLAAFIGL